MKIQLDAETIEGFSERFLVEHYDERVATPQVHRDWWQAVTSTHPRVDLAAPRGHAKSTALNHCYGLAASLFQVHPFELKVCKTWQLACEKLDQAKMELTTNEALRRMFRMRKFVREREDDIIVEMDGGYRFRKVAIGMSQAVRGSTFGTIRPTLIQCDDMEDEVEVLDPVQRDKNMKWLLKTLMPMLADRGQIRVYGTILHNDSVLSRLQKMRSWKSLHYEACNENVDPDSILWPERFSKAKLLDLKQVYIEADDLPGFNMEYRNLAVDEETSYFRSSDFLKMEEEDHKKPKTFYVGGDLAFSKKEGRDYTVLTVGGLDEDGILHIVDERRGRWDGNQVIDEMYSINEAWAPEEWFLESGAIKETLGAALEIRMRDEGYLNIAPGLVPTKDKAIRAVPLQARMRARGIKWDTEASWFAEHKSELLEFTQEGTRGRHDDRVDADAWLAQGIKNMMKPATEEETNVVELAWARRQARKQKLDDEGAGSYELYRAQL